MKTGSDSQHPEKSSQRECQLAFLWAYSSVVERYIRIVQAAVRFCLGPLYKFIKIDKLITFLYSGECRNVIKMKKIKKTAKQLERHFKGVANHRRLDILLLVKNSPGITVEGIAEMLGVNIKTISEHTRKLSHAGLVNKKYKGREVTHTLSPYGNIFTKFIETFQYS